MTQPPPHSQPTSADHVTDQVIIQPAGWRDLLEVHSLEKECFKQDAWPWFDLLAALTFPETVRFKAILNDQVVGFIVGDRRNSRQTGWIATVGVHPDYRRRGIARRLMTEAEEAMGLPRVRLTLRASNQAALTLYQQLGYSLVDSWGKYYADGEDGLVMEKRL
ncbi:MAG: N-acetyltransferase [Anaerolineales bacterium]|jgi:ribosomal-protein-alanine N-acetyltransferase